MDVYSPSGTVYKLPLHCTVVLLLATLLEIAAHQLHGDASSCETNRSFPTRAADKFMALLRDGDCPALLRLVAPHFRYTLTNFDMVGGPAVVFTPTNLSRLCHNTARGFDYRVRRAQDLTATFGQMEVVGADYVSTGGPAPCLVPFLITVVVTLDEKGSIRSLKELMDAESYVRYAQACVSQSSHMLVADQKFIASAAADHGRRAPTVAEFATAAVDSYWAGQCDKLAAMLSRDFILSIGITYPTSASDVARFVGLCKMQAHVLREAQLYTSVITDGMVVTLSGPALMVVPGAPPLMVFSEQSLQVLRQRCGAICMSTEASLLLFSTSASGLALL